jgi:hypothetical protein
MNAKNVLLDTILKTAIASKIVEVDSMLIQIMENVKNALLVIAINVIVQDVLIVSSH